MTLDQIIYARHRGKPTTTIRGAEILNYFEGLSQRRRVLAAAIDRMARGGA
jgi:hypothetical protein